MMVKSSSTAPVLPEVKQCGTCHCWVPGKDDKVTVQDGECHRFPKVSVIGNLGLVFHLYPRMFRTDWCEEYRPK